MYKHKKGDFMELNYKYGKVSTEVKFKSDDDSLFYAMKDGDDVFAVVKVVVKIENEVVAIYSRVFEDKLTSQHYNSFMRKFLEDEDYRIPFLVEGEWKGTIPFSDKDSGVNKKCAEITKKINKKKNPKFKDYANLKTFGRDKYSSMKKEELITQTKEEDFIMINSAFEEEKLVLSALRWRLRGLSVHKAIRKVEVDETIKSNIKK